MAVNWNRVSYLQDIISKTPISFSSVQTAADKNNLATRNKAQEELNYILSGKAERDSTLDAAVSSSMSGVQAILERQKDVDSAVRSMRRAAGQMEGDADALRGYGESMWESGTKVTEQALKTLGAGTGFLDMDASSSPLVAEALELYGNFDPDRYVAQAVQDVQGAADNAAGQTARSLSRMGVNPTSGAALSAQANLQKSLAVMRAAAATRARQQGLNDQASKFKNLIVDPAKEFLTTGGQLASIGSSAQSSAADARKVAVDALANAAGVYGSAASLSQNFGSALAGAYNSLAGVQMSKAGMVYGSSGGGGGGSRTVSTNTGRHYGVGGELLETGNDQVDAMLQLARDAKKSTYEKNLES